MPLDRKSALARADFELADGPAEARLASERMATTEQAAEWMLRQLNRDHMLPQMYAAEEIRRRFGEAFVCEDGGGRAAVREDVLREFRRLSDGVAVWSAARRYWLIEEATPSSSLPADSCPPVSIPGTSVSSRPRTRSGREAEKGR